MVKERHSRDKETFWIYFLITHHEPKLGPIRETETLPFGSGSARISQVGIIRILKTYFHRTRIPNCLWSRANTQQDFAKVIRTHELGEKKGTKKENHNIFSDPWAKIRFIIAGLLKWSLFCFKVFLIRVICWIYILYPRYRSRLASPLIRTSLSILMSDQLTTEIIWIKLKLKLTLTTSLVLYTGLTSLS